MADRPEPSLLFLDFDGVVCDSLEECLRSSAIAFYRRVRGVAVPDFGEAYRRAYRSLRPFVRDGEDYLLIHELLSDGKAPSTQAEFDRARRRAGQDLLAEYHGLFTETRRELIASDRAAWISLNPLYPCIAPLLPELAVDEGAFILSTKKEEFIREILSGAGADWGGGRILSQRGGSKLKTVSSSLEEGADSRAIFIDDQIEHLIGEPDPRIERCLALWGYAAPEAAAPGVRRIRAEEGVALIREFLGRGRRA